VILFRIAIALLKLHESALLACTGSSAVYSHLREMTARDSVPVDKLIHLSSVLLKSKITQAEVDEKRSMERRVFHSADAQPEE
jgi:hypothetical protein